jgi:hypothetical protein
MTCLSVCTLILAGAVATVSGDIPYIEMTRTTHGYEVTFHNARVARTRPDEFTVELDGVEVNVHVASLIGDDPDDMIVFPPPGYWCDPCQARANENQSATVELWPIVGS